MAREKAIEELCEALTGYEPTKWSGMPDLELYMDQVITYLKRQLSLFQDASEASLITPSIINNYVKGGIAPRPVNKRYARPQLAALTMACILKRVLPMQRVKQLTAPGGIPADEPRYEAFCEDLRAVLEAEAAHLKRTDDAMDLEELAMRYALRASADCLIADRLLSMIDNTQNQPAKAGRGRDSNAEHKSTRS